MPQMPSKSKAHSSIRLMHKPNIHWFLTMVWRVLIELEQIRLVWTTGIRFFLILHVTEEMSGQQEFLRLTQLKFVENNLPNK
ncbi:Uncharacterised protein [Acinetobacter baumannii]|nr:Uncharacterised protein [Acinetobacter baumannii]